MTAPTSCQDAAEKIVQQHSLIETAPDDPDDYVGEFSDSLEDIARAYSEKLSFEQAALVWQTADPSINWREWLHYRDGGTPLQCVQDVATGVLIETIKAQLYPGIAI